MDLYLRLIPCCLLCLLTGAESPAIVYPFVSTCAVVGSTVTLPCTFTPRPSFNDDNGRTVPLRVVRVLWCRNHEICQFPTPSVYSSNDRRPSRFHYLGDKQRNCTLQIRKIQTNESATYRFRMEADDSRGHFTNRTGVEVRVTDGPMNISSSSSEAEMAVGGTVTLSCTSTCSSHQLEVRWHRDGHALPESGATLRLGPLTAEDSGNYTCSVKGKEATTTSQPHPLTVLPVESTGTYNVLLTVGVVCGVLLTAAGLAALLCVVRRKRAAAAETSAAEDERKPENLYDNISSSNQQQAGNNQEVEEVSYATVQLAWSNQARAAREDEDAVVYSTVVSRG